MTPSGTTLPPMYIFNTAIISCNFVKVKMSFLWCCRGVTDCCFLSPEASAPSACPFTMVSLGLCHGRTPASSHIDLAVTCHRGQHSLRQEGPTSQIQPFCFPPRKLHRTSLHTTHPVLGMRPVKPRSVSYPLFCVLFPFLGLCLIFLIFCHKPVRLGWQRCWALLGVDAK